MTTNRLGFKIYVKALLFFLVFMVMYGVYRTFPVFPLSLICGTYESNFQHYKAGFFAYLITSLIEYAITRRKIEQPRQFWYARLLATTFLPWMMFVLWYTMPAVYGHWDSIALEIIYANIVTIILGFFVATFEAAAEQIHYNRPILIVLFTLLALSLLEYLVFTFKLPWADVFVEPKWR